MADLFVGFLCTESASPFQIILVIIAAITGVSNLVVSHTFYAKMLKHFF
jgi:hypothetical protein